jgi:hypothetical protein
MDTSTFPVKQGSHIGARWHDIEFNTASGERTEAMNLHGGRVLVRTTVRDSEYGEEGQPPSIAVSTSMLTMSDAMVVKRWAPHVREPEVDEETGAEEPGVIVLSIEHRIAPPTWTHLRSGNTDLLRPEYVSVPAGLPPASAPTRPVFRWFCADDPMPRPTDEQVRAYVEGLPPPNEADSLRRELDEMRERCDEADEQIGVVRAQCDEMREMLSMTLALMSMAKEEGGAVAIENMTAIARPLCEAIAASKDPRIACDARGGRRTPVEVSISLFGEEVALAMWEGQNS